MEPLPLALFIITSNHLPITNIIAITILRLIPLLLHALHLTILQIGVFNLSLLAEIRGLVRDVVVVGADGGCGGVVAVTVFALAAGALLAGLAGGVTASRVVLIVAGCAVAAAA
jgi:hypothetical protein